MAEIPPKFQPQGLALLRVANGGGGEVSLLQLPGTSALGLLSLKVCKTCMGGGGRNCQELLSLMTFPKK